MTKQFILIGLVALTISACSKSDSGGGGTNDKASHLNQDPATMQYSNSYELESNGCKTGKHVFGSNSSADDARKQLCTALEDDALNNSCAESLRKDHFAKVCYDMVWTPKYAPQTPTQTSTTTTTSYPSTPPSNTGFYLQRRVTDALENVLLESYVMMPGLSAQDTLKASQFADELMACGLSYLGPKCLDEQTASANYGTSLNQINGTYVFYSLLRQKKTDSPLALVFRPISIDSMTVTAPTAEVFEVLKPQNGQTLDQYLRDSSSLRKLLVLTIAKDTASTARKRLSSEKNLRGMYHDSRTLLWTTNGTENERANRDFVRDIILKNARLISSSQDALYQDAMLSLIIDSLNLNSDDLAEICDGLTQSPSENVRETAASIVLKAHPNRTDLKPTVFKALQSSDWTKRLRAVQALSNVQKTTSEENILIAQIADNDSDVQTAAVDAAAKIPVNGAHFAAVKNLSGNPNWVVRKDSTILLSRINSSESIQTLIGMIGDNDTDVSGQAVSLLKQKQLTESMIPALAQQIANPNWVARQNAAHFLGSINADQAVLTLIGAMGDNDSDVATTVFSELNRKTIKDSYVNALVQKSSNPNWQVRINADTLLAKNSSLAATTALIANVSDNDADVMAKVYSILSSRVLTNDSVVDLKRVFSSPNWQARKNTASLLGKIKTTASRSALEDQLSRENDSDVKDQIIASLKAIRS